MLTAGTATAAVIPLWQIWLGALGAAMTGGVVTMLVQSHAGWLSRRHERRAEERLILRDAYARAISAAENVARLKDEVIGLETQLADFKKAFASGQDNLDEMKLERADHNLDEIRLEAVAARREFETAMALIHLVAKNPNMEDVIELDEINSRMGVGAERYMSSIAQAIVREGRRELGTKSK